MCESPIDIIYSEIQTKLEGEVFKAVQNVGINVNKDELIKALSYDRQQYEKGYADAKKEQQWIPVTERLPEKYGWYLCSGKDERVMMRFWNNHRWWDNIRKSMFELYDIYGKLTGQKVTDLQEQIDWTDWVIAWMPLPEAYREGGAEECH